MLTQSPSQVSSDAVFLFFFDVRVFSIKFRHNGLQLLADLESLFSTHYSWSNLILPIPSAIGVGLRVSTRQLSRVETVAVPHETVHQSGDCLVSWICYSGCVTGTSGV